jgi:hypothetical protein
MPQTLERYSAFVPFGCSPDSVTPSRAANWPSTGAMTDVLAGPWPPRFSRRAARSAPGTRRAPADLWETRVEGVRRARSGSAPATSSRPPRSRFGPASTPLDSATIASDVLPNVWCHKVGAVCSPGTGWDWLTNTGAGSARDWLAAFGFGLWVGVVAGLRVVKAVAEVEDGSLGVDLGQVVEVMVGWG